MSKFVRIGALFVASLLFVWALVTTLSFASLKAAPDAVITVDTLVDEADGSCSDGDCSLRDAISVANNNDTIEFSVSGTIPLSSTIGELSLTKNVTINGGDSITVSGESGTRIFNISSGVHASFSNLTIANGYVTTTDCADTRRCGGGLLVQNSAAVTLTNAILTENVAGRGGAIYVGEAATVFITNTTMSNNSALSFNAHSAVGATIHSRKGNVVVYNSAFINNYAETGAGGPFSDEGSLTINNSTISGNTADFAGAGGGNFGGDSFINNSTITDNRVGTGGVAAGFLNEGLITTTTYISNTIISGNYISGTTTPSNLGLFNGSTDTFVSGGYNLIGTSVGTITAFSATGDQTDVDDPQLEPLASNGGETQTHALSAGSPALDAANNATCLSTDQRNKPRPFGAACDIGAFEQQGTEKVYLPVVLNQ